MKSYDKHSEEKLLSIMLNHSDKAIAGVSLLHTRCFYYVDNKNLFQAIYDIVDAGESVNSISIMQRTREHGFLDASMREKIVNIIEQDPNQELFSSLAKEVIDYWKIRESNKMIERIQTAISEGTSYSRIRRIMNEYSYLDLSSHRDNPEPITSVIESVIKETEEFIKTGKEREPGIKSGFPKLDKTFSLRPGNCYCIAARPGMGKTSFMLNVIDNISTYGKRIYIISTEMQKEEVMEKFITIQQAIPNEDFRKLSDNDKLVRYKELYSYYSSSGSEVIVDCSVFQLYDSIARIRALYKEKPIDIIFIDYLQQMEIDAVANRVQAMSEMTRKYKQLAMELRVPVVYLSQLSRKCEDRANKRPILSDLRESGSIEQDSSIVMFIYRPSYYGDTEDEKGNDISNLTEFIIAKNRFGKIGIVRAEFDPDTTTFREVTK